MSIETMKKLIIAVFFFPIFANHSSAEGRYGRKRRFQRQANEWHKDHAAWKKANPGHRLSNWVELGVCVYQVVPVSNHDQISIII
jgi:hypothetical protein